MKILGTPGADKVDWWSPAPGDDWESVKRGEFDDVGEQFQKRHFDARLGWHETIVSRRTVCDELITQFTRSASTSTERSDEEVAKEPDTFVVKPVQDLRTP